MEREDRPRPTTFAAEIQVPDGTWRRIDANSGRELAERMGADAVAWGEATAHRVVEVPFEPVKTPRMPGRGKSHRVYTPGNPMRQR